MTTSGDSRQLLLSILVDESDAAARLDDFNQRVQTAQSGITTFQQQVAQPPSLDLSGIQSQLDDLQAALGLATDSVLTLGSNADDASTQLQDLNAAADLSQESVLNLGSASDETASQITDLGSAEDAGSTSATAHAAASREAGSGLSELGTTAGETLAEMLGLSGVFQQGTAILSTFHGSASDAAGGEAEAGEAAVSAGVAISALAVGVGVAGAALVAAKSSFDTFQEAEGQMQEMTSEFGLTTQSAAAMSFQFERVGLSSDDLTTAATRMQAGLSQAEAQIDAGTQPTGRFVDALNNMGISLTNSDGSIKTTGELLPDIFQKFEQAAQSGGKFSDGMTVATAATDLFGSRGGAAAIPALEGINGGLDTAYEKTGKYSDAISANVQSYHNWTEASAELNDSMETVGVTIGGAVAPAVSGLASHIASMTEAGMEAGEGLGVLKDDAATLAAGGLALAGDAASALGTALHTLDVGVVSSIGSAFSTLGSDVSSVLAPLQVLAPVFDVTTKAGGGLDTVLQALTGGFLGEIPVIQQVVDWLDKLGQGHDKDGSSADAASEAHQKLQASLMAEAEAAGLSVDQAETYASSALDQQKASMLASSGVDALSASHTAATGAEKQHADELKSLETQFGLTSGQMKAFGLSEEDLLESVNATTVAVTIQDGKVVALKDDLGFLGGAVNAIGQAINSVSSDTASAIKQQEGLGSATKDTTSAYNAETAAQVDDVKGKSDLAAKERDLEAAYTSGNQSQVEAAQRALTLAQANDTVSASTTKAGTATETAALKETDSLQSVQDALTKAGTAADQLNSKYNDLITGAFGKSHDLSQQMISDEEQQGLAAQTSAQTAYAAWSGFDSAYRTDLANEAAAIQNNDKVGADYWKNQAADANTSANDQKTALTGFITEAEKDFNQANTDSQTLYKDMATAARNSVADQKASISDFQSYFKTFTLMIPQSMITSLDQMEGAVQSTDAQMLALDQSYAAGTSGLTQQQYQDKRQGLQNELSDTRDTFSQEAQAAQDLSTAQQASDQAYYDNHVQLLQMKQAQDQQDAETSLAITVDSLHNQEEVNTVSRKADADQLNAILEWEAGQVEYWTQQKIADDQAYEQTQINIAQAQQDIEVQKSNIEIATANLEVALAESTASAQTTAMSAVVLAAAGAATGSQGAWAAAYQAIDSGSTSSAQGQIDAAAAAANANITAAENTIQSDQGVIAANQALGQSYQDDANSAQDNIDTIKQQASDMTNLANAANSAAGSMNNLAGAENAATVAAMNFHESSGFGSSLDAGSAFGAGGSSSSGGGSSSSGGGMGIGTLNVGAAFGSGSSGLTSGASGGSTGGGSYSPPYPSSGSGSPSAVQAFLDQWGGVNITQANAQAYYDAAVTAGMPNINEYIPIFQSEGISVQPFVPGSTQPTIASVSTSTPALEQQLLSAYSSGNQADVTNLVAVLEQMGVTMQQIQTLLQQSGGLPVSVANAPALATAISSGATQQQTLRPV